MNEQIFVVKPSQFDSPEAYGEELLRIAKRCGADLWGQYGFIPQTPANVIEAFAGMTINQHAGPIRPGRPDFGKLHGRRTHHARLLFVRETGRNFWTECVAQRVTVAFDEGAVLGYDRMPIEKSDDPESLAARLLLLEHEVQIKTLQAFSENRVQEIQFDDDLVRDDEVPRLEEIKRISRLVYPKG
jgi:phosphoribosylglycinamide formyltransferase-1